MAKLKNSNETFLIIFKQCASVPDPPFFTIQTLLPIAKSNLGPAFDMTSGLLHSYLSCTPTFLKCESALPSTWLRKKTEMQ